VPGTSSLRTLWSVIIAALIDESTPAAVASDRLAPL